MSRLQFEQRPLESLIPNPRNARTHDRRQVRQITESIRQFGFANPLLVDEHGHVIAGHGRLEAARSLALIHVPVIVIHGLSELQKRALALADNRIAENAGWNGELLALELSQLIEISGDFDIEVTGFGTAEIDNILADAGKQPNDDTDPVQLPDETMMAVSRPGDVWTLGDHRLVCGNALSSEDWALLMQGEKAELTFTDPPYNVPIAGHVSGKGTVQHREFPMASGEMTDAAFTAFLTTAFGHIAIASRSGAIAFVFMDWRHMTHILDAGNASFHELKNLIVWHKTNAGMGSFYRSAHELIFAFKTSQGSHINNFGLGETGRHRTNVWTHPGANTFRNGRQEDLAAHPTVKPVALVMDAIRDCSRRRGIVLDPFAGSGTILLAAERTGRRARALEMDPLYVDTAIRRWQEHTGRDAAHACGLAFEDMATIRVPVDGTASGNAGQWSAA